MDNIGKVMYLGDKYNMTKCLSLCAEFLINSLNNDNVTATYELAIVFNQVKLQKYCETIVALNTKEVLASECSLECDRKVLNHILKLDK